MGQVLLDGEVEEVVGFSAAGVVVVVVLVVEARRRRMSIGGRNFRGVWWMLGALGGGL